MSHRLEIRLNDQYRRKLEAVLAARRAPAAAVLREMIDRMYEDICREERQRAALELGQLAVEDVPDPETLCRQLDRTYEPTHIR